MLRRELAHLHAREILRELRQTPRKHVLIALGFTASSYWLLGFYDLLGPALPRQGGAYSRMLLTSFIANAFGHNLGLAAFTGAAVRFRLYASAGLTAIDVATVQGFCSLTIGLALATLGGLSLTFEPAHTAAVLHLDPRWAMLGRNRAARGVLPTRPGASSAARRLRFAAGRCTLRARCSALRRSRSALCDLSCSTAVLWWLLPPQR